MMLNNQDEISAFDKLLTSTLADIERMTPVTLAERSRELLAMLFFHDFAEWSSGRRWVIPEFCFEEFDSDDAQKVRGVASACITILKTQGKSGALALMESASDYLNVPCVVGKVWSKPKRISTWHSQFVRAKYSENESERSFRNWLGERLKDGDAHRKTPKGAVSFDLSFLARYGIAPPE
jgi:hypothetical protein